MVAGGGLEEPGSRLGTEQVQYIFSEKSLI